HGEPAGSAQADTAARTEPAAQGDTAARGPEHVLVPMTIPDDMPDATPDETPTEAMVAARKQPRPASIKPAHKRHQPAKHQARKPED
ncbi:MAG: hypothetical protein UHD09_01410, partial [Bifidobacterium sp.]|nr:hypothetical protein [Bifidobacterium sp.]